MPDKNITCSDCGQSFTFSAGEQEYYAQKGFSEPIRCPDCRAARKAARGAGGGSSYSGGRSSMGGDRQMFPAVCAQCGKQTEVPFEPRGDKPVYCSDCYSAQRGASRGGSSSGGYSGGGRSSGGGGGGRGRTGGGGGGGRDRW